MSTNPPAQQSGGTDMGLITYICYAVGILFGPLTIVGVVIAYLNRLGDLLFVLARAANAAAGQADVLWRKPDDP